MPYSVEFAGRAARDLNMLYVEMHTTESPAAARWRQLVTVLAIGHGAMEPAALDE
ncbi:MAG: hypothetical protein ABSG65_36655 [Bryobacteraceae bacterium]|jgi:plasmid stabilization system protein ParE